MKARSKEDRRVGQCRNPECIVSILKRLLFDDSLIDQQSVVLITSPNGLVLSGFPYCIPVQSLTVESVLHSIHVR